MTESQSFYSEDHPQKYETYLINIRNLLNKGEYEAAGIIMGDLIKESFHHAKKHVPKVAMNEYLIGFCHALGINCSKDSLKCWNSDDAIRAFFRIQIKAMEMFLLTSSVQAYHVAKYFSEDQWIVVKQMIPEQILKCDRISEDKQKVRNLLRFYDIGEELNSAVVMFAKSLPEVLWKHYNVAYDLLKKGEYEEYGKVIGLLRLMMAQLRDSYSETEPSYY